MDPAHIPDLEVVLKALANRQRLQLLLILQEPHRLADIAVRSGRDDAWGTDQRPLSRQTIRRHLARLQHLRVIREVNEGTFVVDHARLFEVTEHLRELARVRPDVTFTDETRPLDSSQGPARIREDHLLIVRGPLEGRMFRLPAPAPATGWVIGRDAGCQVVIDHDPFISGRHAILQPASTGWVVVDVPSNRNGTSVNFAPLARGAAAPIRDGDVFGVGKTLMLLRRASR